MVVGRVRRQMAGARHQKRIGAARLDDENPPRVDVSRAQFPAIHEVGFGDSQTCCEIDRIFPSGSLNQATLSPFGAVQIPILS